MLGHNLFAYCQNNPVNKYDPTGFWGSAIHYDDTKAWSMQVGFSEDEATLIASADKSVDSNYFRGFSGNLGHFDQNPNPARDSRLEYMQHCFDAAVLLWKNGYHKAALKMLGYGLHAQQDYYAHIFPYPRHPNPYTDDPSYDWDSKKNKWINKGKKGSTRYKNTRRVTIDWLTRFKNAIK